MCSIMGYCSEAADYEQFRKGFDKTLSRGPDDSRIVDTGKGLLGFHRLAIMGLQPEGMQPFALDGSYVVCNGEIYGFEPMKQALQEKGYNPVNQIVGYILSEDPTYITNHNNARALIRKVDRDELLQTLVKYYLTH